MMEASSPKVQRTKGSVPAPFRGGRIPASQEAAFPLYLSAAAASSRLLSPGLGCFQRAGARLEPRTVD